MWFLGTHKCILQYLLEFLFEEPRRSDDSGLKIFLTTYPSYFCSLSGTYQECQDVFEQAAVISTFDDQDNKSNNGSDGDSDEG